MRVFVTGATGFIGSAVVEELIGNGHEVVGLARSAAAAASLTAAGVIPHRGTIEDLDSLRAAAAGADGAVHTAFFHQFSHARLRTRLRVIAGGSPRGTVSRFLATMVDTDRRAIEAIGTSLAGPDRPLVAAFGTLALTAGRTGTEDDEVDPDSVGGPRGANERAMTGLADRGVRTSIVRLPPIVHGDGDHGFLTQLVSGAREHGVADHAGDGRNRWPTVHRLDAARLFVQALEKGAAGSRFHGVAEEGIPFHDIAGAIGRRLDVPVAAATPAELRARYRYLAMFLGVDNPASSAATRARLGWEPTHRTLLDDIEHGSYVPR
jgi:nucleoside-diphosphate-sugar epimerase